MNTEMEKRNKTIKHLLPVLKFGQLDQMSMSDKEILTSWGFVSVNKQGYSIWTRQGVLLLEILEIAEQERV